MAAADDVPDLLAAHLTANLGAWPPAGPLTVTTSDARTRPGWDGRVRSFEGVSTPAGAVVSVAPTELDRVRNAGPSLDDAKPVFERELGGRVFAGIYRWSVDPPNGVESLGQWIPAEDERIPEWLKPFGGDVLVELDGDRYVAGVGLKRHDDLAWEISVGTEPEARGRGLARRLVVTATRRIVDDGKVALYLHAPDNVASAHVAEASGFPDIGWKILGLFKPGSGPP